MIPGFSFCFKSVFYNATKTFFDLTSEKKVLSEIPTVSHKFCFYYVSDH